MNTDNRIAAATIGPDEIDAVIRAAQQARAEDIRLALSKLGPRLQRLMAHIRPSGPNRQRTRQANARA